MTVLSIYRMFRSRVLDFIVLCAVLIFAAVEVAASPPSYSDMFKSKAVNAAQPVEAHPTVSAYVTLVNSLHEDPLWREKVDALYARQLYFSDTFLVAHTRDQVVAHFERLRQAGGRFQVQVLDVVEGTQGVYLVWGLDSQFAVLGRSIQAGSVGITLFRFDADGRISLQQDFWDSTEGFYRHIPVVGGVVTAIREGVASG